MDKIIRYCPPSKFDNAPYGTIYHVFNEDNLPYSLYIQVSADEDVPHWEAMGDFLAIAFIQSVDDATFIQDCLKLYKRQTDLLQSRISELKKHN